MADLTRLRAHEMAALLRARQVSSRALTEAHLAAAERQNRALNAWLVIGRAEALAQAMAGLRAMNFQGINLTIPHKVTVMQYLDEIARDAAMIGAVCSRPRRSR